MASTLKMTEALRSLVDNEHPEPKDVFVWLLEQHHGSTVAVSRHLDMNLRVVKDFLYENGLGGLPAQIRARVHAEHQLPDYPFGNGMKENDDGVRGE